MVPLHSVVGPPPGLLDGLGKIADILKREGPFDGIIAFSQGALLATKTAFLLDDEARNIAHIKGPNTSTTVFQHSQAFRELTHPPLKSGIFCASSVKGGYQYDSLHGDHENLTQLCLANGIWDPTTSADDQYAVFSKLSNDTIPSMVKHDGGHCIPTDMGTIKRVVAFLYGTMCLRSGGDIAKAAMSSRYSQGVDYLALQRRLRKLQGIRRNVLHHDT